MTSTVKHTPGKWEVLHTRNWVQSADTKVSIASCNFVGLSADEMYANAKLIAAAPDLLEQLKWTLWVLEDAKLEDVNLDITRAVIAIATGEQS